MWYSDGSIQVAANGAVATGTGTKFLDNVRVGDGLTIAGSAAMHEVIAIPSDTQLTFSPPYAGAAGSGKAYRIAPIQGYVADAARRLVSLTKDLGDFATNNNLKALAAAVGAANKGLMFTAPGVMGTFDVTAQARVFLAATTIAAQRAALDIVLTSSYLDQTPGRVVALDPVGRGFHGLGNSSTVPALSDFKGLNRTCLGLFTTGTLNGPPVGSNGGYLNIFANAADSGYQVMFAGSYGSPNRWAFGKKSNLGDPVWAEAWHSLNLNKQPTPYTDQSGDVLVNGSFGLGRFGEGLSNLNAAELGINAFGSALSTASGNNFSNRCSFISSGYAETERTQILLEPATETMRLRFRYSSTAGVWKPDRDVWHSGNLLVADRSALTGITAVDGGRITPLDKIRAMFMAANTTANTADWNANIDPGVSDRLMGVSDSNGPGLGTLAYAINYRYNSLGADANLTQMALSYVAGLAAPKLAMRGRYQGTWSNWAEVWTTANLTPNQLNSYTLASLPSAAANPRLMAWVSNLTGGAKPCYSDGTTYRRMFDNSPAN